MSPQQNQAVLDALARILDVSRKLATAVDLTGMLSEVVHAGKSTMRADLVRLWLHDTHTHELVLQAPATERQERISVDAGLPGKCFSSGQTLSISDCNEDPRFDAAVDGLRDDAPRCMLVLPVIGGNGTPIGVMQLINTTVRPFNAEHELISNVLAAQCAVAVRQTQITAELIVREHLDTEVSVAREIQLSTLPTVMPEVPGYDAFGMVRPTAQTGGDTFDLVMLEDRLFMLLGDATGHGFGPALSATQMQAMLRVAFRLGADLGEAFTHVNNQLVEDLPDDRFVTAFMGFLDPSTHRVTYHSGGQGPILHFHAAGGESELHEPTRFPMGVFEMQNAGEPRIIDLAPGDILGLISDGVYEYANRRGEQFGETGVGEVLLSHHDLPMRALADRLLEKARDFAGDMPQHDDITIVLIRRLPV